MKTLRVYIKKVDAYIQWVWSKKWIRLPTSVLLVLFSSFIFTKTIITIIILPPEADLYFWLVYVIIQFYWVVLFYCGVKGLLK